MARPVYVVHCVDTEGPLHESVEATFERLKGIFGIELEPSVGLLRQLQAGEVDLGGIEQAVRKVVDPHLLAYNDTWDKVDAMLASCMSPAFRTRPSIQKGTAGSTTGSASITWTTTSTRGVATSATTTSSTTTRASSVRRALSRTASSSTTTPTTSAAKPIAARRTGGRRPTACSRSSVAGSSIASGSRPPIGPGSTSSGRTATGSWSSTSRSTSPARPSPRLPTTPPIGPGRRPLGRLAPCPRHLGALPPAHDDYQERGSCRRWIARCLNIGTRYRLLSEEHVRQAYAEAASDRPVVLAFTNHDFRDMRPDIDEVRELLIRVGREFPDVPFLYSEASPPCARRCSSRRSPPASSR